MYLEILCTVFREYINTKHTKISIATGYRDENKN